MNVTMDIVSIQIATFADRIAVARRQTAVGDRLAANEERDATGHPHVAGEQ